MPELPEVEVVRRGLETHVSGRTVHRAEVLSPRAARRYLPGPAALVATVTGASVTAVRRRGKYLWLQFDADSGADALVVHLGMSGQMLVRTPGGERHRHLRAMLDLGESEVHFVDQRTFGWWLPAPLVEVDGTFVPEAVAHIARDPLDPRFDPDQVVARMYGRPSEIKRLLLDQTVIAGVGNIYADEALWRVGVHGARPAAQLSRPKLRALIGAATEVMGEALDQGGTSFDALYVDVDGDPGYFSRALAVYGREDLPCPRCGAPIRREGFMNRSSYSCPRCQSRPRTAGPLPRRRR